MLAVSLAHLAARNGISLTIVVVAFLAPFFRLSHPACFLPQLFLTQKSGILAMLDPTGHMYKYMNDNIFGEG